MSDLKRRNSDETGNQISKKIQNDTQTENGPLAVLFSLIPERQEKIELTEQLKVTFGRSRSCDIVLSAPDISTLHAELHLIEVQINGLERKLFNIVDKSRNGTFVNGHKLVKKDYVLKNGDRIVFGKSSSYLFKYAPLAEKKQFQMSSTSQEYDGVFKKPLFNSQGGGRRSSKQKEQVLSFFDKYVAGKDLGTGHYAVVKEAKNKETGQVVAVKIFHPQMNDDKKKTMQFAEETEILLSITHPNIVKLIDRFVEPLSKTKIQTYLVLEKINDGELFERIVRKTKLRQDETKAIFKQLLSGLKYLHDRNIIHRDIKPENILLSIQKRKSADEVAQGPWDEDEIDIQVKIADFGLAKFTGELNFTNTLCGTPSYVAPEVLSKKGYTSQVDLWSSGVLLYVCLCGFPPFSDQLAPPNMKDQILQGKYFFFAPYWDDIDDCVLHLISNLLVVNPEKRFSVIETLDHPWFRDSSVAGSPNPNITRSLVSGNKIPKTFSDLSNL